jgi:prefoldin subunit 5
METITQLDEAIKHLASLLQKLDDRISSLESVSTAYHQRILDLENSNSYHALFEKDPMGHQGV